MKSLVSQTESLFSSILCLSLSLILFSSCGPSPNPTPDQVLTVVQSSVSIGDPHIASDSSNRLSILFSIYEALVGLDQAGNVQPVLAERWEVDPDARSWTFFLRQDVRFHNGEVLTASDVVATLGRVLDPGVERAARARRRGH